VVTNGPRVAVPEELMGWAQYTSEMAFIQGSVLFCELVKASTD